MSAGKDEFPPLKALPAAGKASSHDAPLGRRQQQRIATRERIYKTAIEEFEREGVAAAQIDRIAEKAGAESVVLADTIEAAEEAFAEASERNGLSVIVSKVEAVGPASFAMDIGLLENRFEFARHLAGLDGG